MKQRLLAFMLVPALLALSGCHGTRGRRSFEVPETFDASRSYEITFWAKNDTNKTQTAIYQQAIESFQALYPGITVTMRLYTDYGKIYNDVITNIATDTTPNVCITYPDHIATYLTGDNVVAPLDALMDDPAYGLGGSEIAFDAPTRDEIVSEYLAECSFGGHTYALPFMRSTETCYVNQNMVEALGYELPDVLTWDFLWEVADRAAEKDADGVYRLNGQQVMIPVIYKSTDNMMIQLLRQSGAGYSDGDGNVLLLRDEGASVHHRRSGASGRVLHVQDFQLSRQFPQRRPVRVRHKLHRVLHMDGLGRAADGHQRGQGRALPHGGAHGAAHHLRDREVRSSHAKASSAAQRMLSYIIAFGLRPPSSSSDFVWI